MALALSPDEKQLVSSDSTRVIIWDVESAMPLVTLENKVPVTSLDWSPDYKRIVAGGNDGTVKIWTLPVLQK